MQILFFNRYLIEIAKIYNIEYEPDPQVMKDDNRPIGNLKEKLKKTSKLISIRYFSIVFQV